MTPLKKGLVVAACIGVAGVITWLLFAVLPNAARPAARPQASNVPSAPAAAVRKIKAQLFYVSEDGVRLTSVEHDVTYAEQAVDQAREILKAQIAPVDPPLVSAVPPGTAIRALFLMPQGEAFVDLSPEFASAHPGGSVNELLTIYALVHALTINLPAVTSVQLLVGGKEVDTLAGHVDLRRPLTKNLQLMMETPNPESPVPDTQSPTPAARTPAQ